LANLAAGVAGFAGRRRVDPILAVGILLNQFPDLKPVIRKTEITAKAVIS
jgi:hypothetical protein